MTRLGTRYTRSSARLTCAPWKPPSASSCSARLQVLLLLSALALAGQPLPTAKGINFYSIAKEIEIGRASADLFTKTVKVIHKPVVDAYLNRIGQELAHGVEGDQFPYSFTLFQGDVAPPPMAFPNGSTKETNELVALAGGPIFVGLPMLQGIDNEGELAAVMAHAIAHIALRHSTRTATRAELFDLAWEALPPQARQSTSAPVSIPVAFLKFARRFEADADKLAVYLLAQAGYDPAGLLSYLRKLPAEAQPTVFSAQPRPQARIQAVETAIQSLPARFYRSDSSEFDAIVRLATDQHR